jgi:hypothetical protein
MAKRPNNERIAITFGDPLLDIGMVSDLPKALLWFFRYLVCDGERLDDRRIMPLVLMIALKEGPDGYGLRLIDLPTTTPSDTLRDYQTQWKRMGLLFTSREYYTREEMHEHFGENPPSTPRLKHVVYDLSNLMYNTALVAQEWVQRNLEYQAGQERRGVQDPEPYTFPDDYLHEMELAPEVAFKIVTGAYDQGKAGVDSTKTGLRYWYIPPKWWNLAHEMFGLSPNLDDRGDLDLAAIKTALEKLSASSSPVVRQHTALQEGNWENHVVRQITAVREGARDGPVVRQITAVQEAPHDPVVRQITAVRSVVRQNTALQEAPPGPVVRQITAVRDTYCGKLPQSLIEEEEEKEEEEDRILLHFAALKNEPGYDPSERERKHVAALCAEGYTVDQIITAIDEAFDTRRADASPIRGFGYIVNCLHRRHRPTGAQSPAATGCTDDQPTRAQPTGTPGRTDGQSTGAQLSRTQPTGVQAVCNDADATVSDPLEQVYVLLQAAQHDGTVYDTPVTRLGLRHFQAGDDPFSPDEIYAAVMETVTRNIAPEHLIGYVKAVLEDKRDQRRKRDELRRAVEAATRTGSNDLDDPAQLASFTDHGNHQPTARTQIEALWSAALSELELQMTKATFNTWVKPLSALLLEDDVVVLEAPNGYVKDWVKNRLHTPIERTMSGILGRPVGLQVIAEEGNNGEG